MLPQARECKQQTIAEGVDLAWVQANLCTDSLFEAGAGGHHTHNSELASDRRNVLL